MEIQLLTRERLKNVAELNWLMESQPSPLDNWISYYMYIYKPLPLDNWISYYMYTDLILPSW